MIGAFFYIWDIKPKSLMNTKFINPDPYHFKEWNRAKAYLQQSSCLTNCTFQELDFQSANIDWNAFDIKNTTFLGCQISDQDIQVLLKKGACILPEAEGLPYRAFRKSLYHWKELMDGFDPQNDQSTDFKIYQHFSKYKFGLYLFKDNFKLIKNQFKTVALLEASKYYFDLLRAF